MRKQIKSLLKSFGHAFSGIALALKNERNMRIHISIGVAVLLFCTIFKPSSVELAIISLCIGLVIACEMINTAIEAVVDKQSDGYSPLSKFAKDASAGATLVSAIGAVLVGIFIFAKPKLITTLQYLILTFPYNILAIVYIILALIFVFGFPNKSKK